MPVEAEQETGTKKRTKKQKRKKGRKERLLKFQEKLVKTRGLPQSRLMEQVLRIPPTDLDKVKRSLASEFEQLGRAEASPTSVPEPGTVPAQHATTAPCLHDRTASCTPCSSPRAPAPVLGVSQMPTSCQMPGKTAENSNILPVVPHTNFLPKLLECYQAQ